MNDSLGIAIRALDAAIGAFEKKDVIYLSTPITTGKTFYETGKSCIEQNRKNALLSEARVLRLSGCKCVINPARFSQVSGWYEDDYMNFWYTIIDRYVGTVVFANNWHYSAGCCKEFVFSIKSGLPTMDFIVDDPIDLPLGIKLVTRACNYIDSLGKDNSKHLQCYKELCSLLMESQGVNQ